MARTWSSEAGVLPATGDATRVGDGLAPAGQSCVAELLGLGHVSAPTRSGQRVTHGGRDLGREPLGLPELVLVVEPRDEAVEAQVAGELDELVDPVLGRAA